jgi:hypothetical protein
VNHTLGNHLDLPTGWSLRPAEPTDLDTLVALRTADRTRFAGPGPVDPERVENEIIGLASWTRQQVVALDEGEVIRAWASVHDRAAGRTMVHLYVDRTEPSSAELAAALYGWMAERARVIARMRGLHETQLYASPFAEDVEQRGWLAAAGYRKVRSWLQMTRPVRPGEASSLPQPRPGVVVRPVDIHPNGLPVASDLRTVHRMLEESFADHFISYRESFPEFVPRLR